MWLRCLTQSMKTGNGERGTLIPVCGRKWFASGECASIAAPFGAEGRKNCLEGMRNGEGI